MSECTFDIQFITPCFMYGAFQTDEPELRAPSIKGAMRFWFRAMMGMVLNDNVQMVKHWEGKLFGYATESDSEELKAQASAISIELISKNTRLNKTCKEFSKENRGLVYLSFPFLKWDNNQQDYKLIRQPIDIKSTYRLKLRSILNNDENALKIAAACIWLLANLGSVGSRSRRGFGSFIITGVSGDTPSLNFSLPGRYADLKKYYEDNLNKIRKIFSDYANDAGGEHGKYDLPDSTGRTGQRVNQFPEFDSFSCWKGCLLSGQDGMGWISWDKALNDIGRHLRKTREYGETKSGNITKTTDYINVVSRYLNNEELNSIDLKNDIFGLPNQIRSSSRKKSAMITWERAKQKDKEDQKDVKGDMRRASPLLIKLVHCGNSYFILLQYFRARFLPQGAHEIIKPTSTKDWPDKSIPQPKNVIIADYTVLEEFAGSLTKSLKGTQISF